MTTGVVIADDQTLLRSSFRMLIESDPGMTVLGEAADGAEAVRLAGRAHPDVVLMDVRMPGMDGIEATRRITADMDLADVRVLILTTFDLDEYVYGALRAGASGFVLKETSPEDVLAAIRLVAAGEALLAPSVTRRLIAEFARWSALSQPPGASLDILTAREQEVMSHVACGLSNVEIAEALQLSVGTVKTHVSRLLAKLGARDRAQLVIIAYETGLARRGRPWHPLAPKVSWEDQGSDLTSPYDELHLLLHRKPASPIAPAQAADGQALGRGLRWLT